MNSLSYFALQPISELGIWGWRLERRTEFLWREQFDRYLLPSLFPGLAITLAVLGFSLLGEGLRGLSDRR